MTLFPARPFRLLLQKAPVLFLLLAFIPTLLWLPATARGEASADLLGRYSCAEVKKLAMSAPQELFAMWAESRILGDGTGLADEIAKRGNVNLVLANIADINTAIQGLEEAAFGDWKKVAEIFADWLLDKTLALTGSGIPGAVWTVCKELNQFAVDLNAEILDINIRTYATFAERDPEILGKNGVEHFLKNYLDADMTEKDTFDLVKRRASLGEYAKVKLGIKDFPGVREWKDNWNQVRSVAASMLREVDREVVKRKKFRQLQGALREQLDQLKREKAVLTTFQGLLNQVHSMTCQDTPKDCLDALVSARTVIEGLILDAGDIPRTPPAVTEDISGTVAAINADLDALFKRINAAKPAIAAYCAKGKDEFQAARQTVALAQSAAGDAAAQAVRAKGYREEACAATSLTAAKSAAAGAAGAVEVAARVANSLSFLESELGKHAPPQAIDFSGAQDRVSELDTRLTDLEASISDNFKKKEKFTTGVAAAREQVNALEKKCKGAKEVGTVAELLARLDKVAANTPDVRADINTLAALQSKAGLLKKRIAGLKSTEKKDRECLQDKPDIAALSRQVASLSKKAQASLDAATEHARAAAACHDALKHKCGPNERMDDQENCICKEGYEKVDGDCVPKCGANEERTADGGCDCKPGYERVDGVCTKPCGRNEQRSADGGCECKAGYTRVDGICVQEVPPCRSDRDCPRGYECNARTGKCVPARAAGCRSDSECPPGYVCNRKSGKCVSPFDDGYDDYTNTMAQRDDDRGQGVADQVASDQNAPNSGGGYGADDLSRDLDTMQDDLAGKCSNNAQCPPGYVCRNGECVEKPKCTGDGDCPAGFTCVKGNCVKKADCAADADCPAGYLCKNGKCVQKAGCGSNTDCPKGQICKDGKCVAAPITPATLAVSPANKAVILNETVQLKAVYTDTDGTTKDVTGAAQWSPSSTFSKGNIGVYTVTASHKGLTASSHITVVQEKGMDDVTVNKKTITVTFWDHGQEDGDMIDIVINGKTVFPGITLTNAHQSRTITLNADIIVVGFRALNVGSISPNTATVTFSDVTAGKETQKYTLSKNQSANMNVNYKP